MIYKGATVLCAVAIAVNVGIFGLLESARFNVPLLVAISGINLWQFRQKAGRTIRRP